MCSLISRFTTFLPKGQDINEWWLFFLWQISGVGGGCSGGVGGVQGEGWDVVRGVFWKAVTYPKHRIYAGNLMWPPSSFHSFWDLPRTLQGRPGTVSISFWDSFWDTTEDPEILPHVWAFSLSSSRFPDKLFLDMFLVKISHFVSQLSYAMCRKEDKSR